MCDQFIPSGDEGKASLLVLCKGARVGHILAWRNITDDPGDGPATAALAALAANAVTVLAEDFYFDVDYRSEVALLQANQFAYVEPTVDRLHFFTTSFAPGSSVYKFLLSAKEEDGLHEAARAGGASTEPPTYLGYTTVRPGRTAHVGRSLITPWTEATVPPKKGSRSKPVTITKESVHQQVRAAVAESVNIFGVDFRAVGVPFMEQDGALLRCAHVSAWICHYAAVLRGLSTRMTTRQFHLAGNTVNALARPYPSTGLSTSELANILRAANLPPEVLTFNELHTSRELSWADRQSLHKAHRSATSVERRDRLWITENLCATVCRYLNSGIPVILARDGIDHTQVVVGYLRRSDIESASKAQDDDHSDVVAFLVSDDQVGPYEVVRVDELVDEVLNYGKPAADTQVVVPLPSGLWVNGEEAEARGAALLERAATSRRDRLAVDRKGSAEFSKLDAFVKALASKKDAYTIRTYASTGVDFKRSAQTRMSGDPNMVRAIAQTQMPRHVWVCEAIDRKERKKKTAPSVTATLVLDATAPLANVGVEAGDSDLAPLFLHVASQYYSVPYAFPDIGTEDTPLPEVVVRITDAGKEQISPEPPADVDELDRYVDLDGVIIEMTSELEASDWWWRDTTVDFYYTGRWSHERISAMTSSHVAALAKSADSAT